MFCLQFLQGNLGPWKTKPLLCLDFRGTFLLPTNTAELHLSWTGLATRCTGVAVQSEVPVFVGGNSQHVQFILDFHPALTLQNVWPAERPVEVA